MRLFPNPNDDKAFREYLDNMTPERAEFILSEIKRISKQYEELRGKWKQMIEFPQTEPTIESVKDSIIQNNIDGE